MELAQVSVVVAVLLRLAYGLGALAALVLVVLCLPQPWSRREQPRYVPDLAWSHRPSTFVAAGLLLVGASRVVLDLVSPPLAALPLVYPVVAWTVTFEAVALETAVAQRYAPRPRPPGQS